MSDECGVLYHYTGFMGFQSIVSTKTLRASSLHHMNDATEFSYAKEIAASVAKEILDQNAAPEQREVLELFCAHAANITPVPIFASCFSEDGDLLSQWRGYCPGGRGVAIGFDRGELATVGRRNGFELIPCVYDEEQQRNLITEAIQRGLSASAGSNVRRGWSLLWSEFIRVAPCIKEV
jgi:hypothetical protein